MGMASRTSDGGKTWTPLKLINTQALDITAVQSVSALTAFAYGSSQQVWKTLDGGTTWSRYRPAYYDRYGAAASPNVYVNDVVPASGRHFLLGSGGAIMYTADKATTWRFVSGDFFDRLLDASFESTSSGLVLGEKAMYYTTNGGATWAKRALPGTPNWSAVSIGPNKAGWLVGTDDLATAPYVTGVVYRTRTAARPSQRRSHHHPTSFSTSGPTTASLAGRPATRGPAQDN